MKKIIIIAFLLVAAAISGVVYWRYYFVFGEGVKAGDLNFIVYKGYVFKTWEGRLIQTGFKTKVAGAVQSNEFDFSVANDSIARILELNSGKTIEVRYVEYLHALPWRGMNNYVVTEIIKIEETQR